MWEKESDTRCLLRLICTSSTLDLKKTLQRQIMVGEINKNVFLIQIDASSLSEFEISEFEISRFDCSQYFRAIHGQDVNPLYAGI